jgi:hypothetical protein
MPFWLTLEQPNNHNLVKYLKLFLAQASLIIWSSRVKHLFMETAVRAGEDKSNINNLREITKIALGESEDREMTSSILNGITSFGEQREEWTRSSTTGSGVS